VAACRIVYNAENAPDYLVVMFGYDLFMRSFLGSLAILKQIAEGTWWRKKTELEQNEAKVALDYFEVIFWRLIKTNAQNHEIPSTAVATPTDIRTKLFPRKTQIL